MTDKRVLQVAKICLQVPLSAGFLSAIADRFGLCGPPGAAGVSWGDWAHFLQFVAYLNSFMPKALIPTNWSRGDGHRIYSCDRSPGGVYQRIVAWASAASSCRLP